MKRRRLFSLLAIGIALAGCNDQRAVAPVLTPSADNVGWSEVDDPIPTDLTATAFFTTPQGRREMVREWIGPEGGRLRLNDFEVIVPAGAVEKRTLFTIKLPASPEDRKHAVAQFQPHRTFAVPVTLILPYASTDAAGDQPSVIWFSRGEWFPLETSLTSDGRIQTQTNHFSVYATRRGGLTVAGG